MPSSLTQKLIDIRDNIVLARQWSDGLTIAELSNDKLRFYAVTRALEIISEASRGLDTDVKHRHPELPWADIAGAGNVYRHDYEEIADRLIWETVNADLPPLLAVVEFEIASAG